MSKIDLVKSFLKHRIMLPIIRGLKLDNNRLFTYLFNASLTVIPFSESTRIRLRDDFLNQREDFSPTIATEAKDPNQIAPVSLIKIKGPFNKFSQTIKFERTDSPLVSIIIPVYNHIEDTLCCLKSLSDNLPKTPIEIIVIDDCSTDSTPQLLKKIHGLTLIRNEENINFLKSTNKGAYEAKGRFLLFLHNGTQVLDNWLEPMLEVFHNQKDTGLVGAKIVCPSGILQAAGSRIDLHGNSVMIGLNDNPSAPQYNYLREVDYCSRIAIMIEADLFQDMKGFDELFAPGYYEDADLAYRVRKAGRKIFYQPATVICHDISVSTNDENNTKIENIHKSRRRFLERWQEDLIEAQKIRLIAFYLPQFHTIPENDEWWGKGFTEWTNTKKAKPNFEGHYQPKVPDDLGYYDLRDDEVRARQTKLAKEYGVSAFCYYYYWFNGKKLLETPLEMLIANKSLDFPFCICWANEDWTRTWDGESTHVLMKQEYSTTAYKNFIKDVFPLFTDRRYLRINGRPVLLLYRAQRFDDCQYALEMWRKYCLDKGENLYIISVDSFGEATCYDHNNLGFDAIVEFPPHAFATQYNGDIKLINENFSGHLYDYKLTSRNFTDKRQPNGKFFRCAMPSWDNTARRQDNPHTFVNSSPEDYQKWLTKNIEHTHNFFIGEEKITFVNAWNEWGEGNYLEPDTCHGFNFLEATKKAVSEEITIKTSLLNKNKIKLAVIIHAFYPNILSEILDSLGGGHISLKLFVSTPIEKSVQVQKILASYPFNYSLIPVNNKGRDILPFLKITNQIITEGFDLFLKVHTKRSKHRIDGDIWRNDIYKKLLPTKALEANTFYLESNPDVGMIGPSGHIVPMTTYWGANKKRVLKLAKSLGITENHVMNQSFIAGTMFYAKAATLVPLLKLELSDVDFEDEAGQVDGTMAHVVERLFAISTLAAGMTVVSYDNFLSIKATNQITNDYDFADKCEN